MKLLFESWRRYLNEEGPDLLLEELSKEKDFADFLVLLNEKRQEKTKNILQEQPAAEAALPEIPVTELPVGAIFCDMDGVLADFSAGLLNLIDEDLSKSKEIKKTAVFAVGLVGKFEYYLKILKNKISGIKATRQYPSSWDNIEQVAQSYFEKTGHPDLNIMEKLKQGWERFFESLPPTPGGLGMWKLINYFDSGRITLLTGAPGGEGVLHAKVEWAKKHLQPPPQHIIKQSDKRPYAIDPETDKPNLLIDDWSHNVEGWEEAGGIAVAYDEENPKESLKAVGDILTGEG
jgi:hypothetical protein